MREQIPVLNSKKRSTKRVGCSAFLQTWPATFHALRSTLYVSSFLLALLGSRSEALGQNIRLEEIEMINMGNAYRIFIQCSGPIDYESQFDEPASRLSIYLRNTVLDLKKNHLTYPDAPVSGISAEQTRKSPATVTIDIALRRELRVEIDQKMDTMIFVDLMEKDPPSGANVGVDAANGSSASAHDGLSHATKPNPYYESVGLNEGMTLDPLVALSNNDRISLEANDVEITDVLRLLAKQTKLNIVAVRDTGRVSVNLENVSVREALDMIARANGFDYLIEDGAVLIKPADKFKLGEMHTKVFRLQYIDANNLESAISQVLSDQAQVKVFHNDFQPVKEAQAPTAGGGPAAPQQTTEKPRSSTLVVTDVPARLRQVEAMVTALDVPTPQIMIEAKLIEIAPQAEEKLGIDWSKTISAEIFREVLLPSGAPYRYSAEKPLEGGAINFGTLSLRQYNAVLDFLNSNTNSKLVSNPRILAMDNQRATISVGSNIPIPQINRGVGGQGDVVTFEYLDVNISLEVTPHVAGDQTISLHVNPIIEEIVGQVAAGANSAPITSRREVETVVNLKSNQTMVIGGLIKESTIDTINKVWLLGDVPLIGNFFRHKSKSKRQTDLLIFITPRLL